MNSHLLPPESPWNFLAPFGRPDIRWCEKLSEGFLAEPGNALSNASYLLVGFFLLWSAKNHKDSPRLKLMALVSFYTGLASFLYHMTYSFLFQILDFSAIFLITLPPILWNLQWLGRTDASKEKRNLMLSIALMFFLFFSLRFLKLPVQLLLALLMLIFLATEFKIALLKNRRQSTHFLLLALVFFIAGFYTNFLDVSRRWCEPEGLIHGHVLWHLLSALGIGFLAKYTNSWQKKGH